MECIVVQDLFLNETAKFAHVFLPGTSFLEKDGTFINAERRINRVRPVMKARQGKDEWLITQELSIAMGYPMNYSSAAEIMDEIAELTPTFTNVSFAFLDRVGSVQWPCNASAPMGTPIMHIDNFVRGKGLFVETEYVPTEERTNRKFPLLLTTGRILSQYNVGAQTRRTANMVWYDADLLEVHPSDAELRGIKEGDLVSLSSRKGEIASGCDHHRARAARRRLHDLPQSGDRRQRRHDRAQRLGDQLPRVQGHRRTGCTGQASQQLAARLRREREAPKRVPRNRQVGGGHAGDIVTIPHAAATGLFLSLMARCAALYFGRGTPRSPPPAQVRRAVATGVSRRELKRSEASHSGEKCPSRRPCDVV